ncbi:MAG: Maf family nucleotide pyrophosphatase [Pseudomonadota bacterium]
MTTNTIPSLILASTSPYRRTLLERLELAFSCEPPKVDEAPKEGEAPRDLAVRLAQEKALNVSTRFPEAIVIGGDQVASRDGQPIGKPGTRERAIAQLTACQGKEVLFHSGVAIAREGQVIGTKCRDTVVTFRNLPVGALEDYVDRDRPLDCAGSFKWEGLGISLFESLRSDDPTALEGLPLIDVVEMLRDFGVNILNIN